MLSYGIIDYIGAILARSEGTVKITFWYFAVSSIIMAIIGLLFVKPPAIPTVYIAIFATLSVLSAFSLLAFLKGLKVGSISIVSPIASAYPIVIVFAGVLLLNEAITISLGAGIVLIILGAVFASFKMHELRKLKLSKAIPGVKYALIALFGWGILYASIGIISKSLGWFYPVFIISVGSAIALFIYSWFGKIDTAFPLKIKRNLFAYATIGTAAFLFYSIGTNIGSIAVVGPITGAAPLITVILAMALKGEKVEINQAIGIIFIISGIVILSL